MSASCVVEVGHPAGTPAEWVDTTQPTFKVCDRHRQQYDERPDLGPYDWVPLIDGTGGGDA